MEKVYCPYCGELVSNGCDCERIAAEEHDFLVEEIEERQHKNGFYAFQDAMDSFRFER